jgi:hypothetical protein
MMYLRRFSSCSALPITCIGDVGRSKICTQRNARLYVSMIMCVWSACPPTCSVTITHEESRYIFIYKYGTRHFEGEELALVLEPRC